VLGQQVEERRRRLVTVADSMYQRCWGQCVWPTGLGNPGDPRECTMDGGTGQVLGMGLR
jgi:hypothetical protein